MLKSHKSSNAVADGMARAAIFGVGGKHEPAFGNRMTILAFDTCFGACSAAVWSRAGNCVLAERFETMEKGHSERIVPMIGEVLASASVSLGDLAAIAVTVGPGSFTGVRTGLAVARALGLARGFQIRGTTSLHVMAARLRDSHADMPIAIAVATRDRLVYLQTFALADAAPASPARLATAEEAARDLGAVPHAIAGTGAAWWSPPRPRSGSTIVT